VAVLHSLPSGQQHASEERTEAPGCMLWADHVAALRSQTLLNVLKRETVNLTKKKQSSGA